MNRTQQKRRRHKLFGVFGKRRATRAPGRRLMVEPMEGRILMTADLGGNSFAAATELGTLSGTRQIADYVGSSGYERLLPLPRRFAQQLLAADGRDERRCGCPLAGQQRRADRQFRQRRREPRGG